MLRASVCCAFALLAVAGCGSDEEKQTEVLALEVHDQSFGLLEDGESLVLSLVDRAGACEAAQALSLFPEASALSVLLRKSSGGVVEPGTYAVWSLGSGFPLDNLAVAEFARTDAACQNELSSSEAMSIGGTVRLETFDPSPGGHARGSYDLRFAGGPLAGEFDAVFCALPADFATAAPGCR